MRNPRPVCEIVRCGMKLTKEELAQIRERCEKALPGPWDIKIHQSTVNLFRLDNQCTARQSVELCEPNRNFIAASRTDIPKLLSHIDELERENERLQVKLGMMRDTEEMEP